MQNLSSSLWALLNESVTAKKVKRDSYLFKQGEEASFMYIIRSGKFQVAKVDKDGKELTLRICKKDDIVGELILFKDNPTYFFTVKCLQDGEVGVIRREEFESKLGQNNEMALEFIRWMSDHFRRTQTKFRDLVLNGKKGAIYSILIRLANSYGKQTKDGILIDVPFSNKELANFCGVTRESVNRILQEMRSENLLSVEGKKIIIHDLEKLKIMNNCEDCPPEICSID
jgi:CRP/FNR family transcriptional regulator, cyclic AMP receptor protein